jgi:hypothetical protein
MTAMLKTKGGLPHLPLLPSSQFETAVLLHIPSLTIGGFHWFGGLYLLEGVPVTVCVVATVGWEGSPGVAVFG